MMVAVVAAIAVGRMQALMTPLANVLCSPLYGRGTIHAHIAKG
jgi:hypothetical protein